MDHGSPPWKNNLRPFVDLIEFTDGRVVDLYARHPRGFHVPITTLTPQQVRQAWERWGDERA